MKRRIVLATCLAAAIGGGASMASAAPHAGASTQNHNVCILIANNDNYGGAKYICISTPNP